MARRRKKRPSSPPPSDTPLPDDDPEDWAEEASPAKRLRGAAWRMFPFRGRFLSPDTRYVYERLPAAPATFSSVDVAVLCVEADRALGLEPSCNPAEVIDLLTSRSLVVWTDHGFVKRSRPPQRPRA